jgi:hypothetical protein
MPSFSADQLSTWLLLGGILAIAFVVLRSQWRSGRRSSAPGASAARDVCSAPTPAQPHQAPADLSAWQAEMHELARELSAKLDSKIVLLETLIRQARAEADRLERLQRETSPDLRGHVNPAVAGNGAEPPLVPSSKKPRRHEEIYELADAGCDPAEIARRTGALVGEVELILGLRRR